MTQIFEVPFPFCRTQFEEICEEGARAVTSWKPGTECDAGDSEYGGRNEYSADAMGLMTLEVISRHKPGKYPERVFYIRQWIDPDGNKFGKTNLRVTASSNFARLCKGYAHHFTLVEEEA